MGMPAAFMLGWLLGLGLLHQLSRLPSTAASAGLMGVGGVLVLAWAAARGPGQGGARSRGRPGARRADGLIELAAGPGGEPAAEPAAECAAEPAVEVAVGPWWRLGGVAGPTVSLALALSAGLLLGLGSGSWRAAARLQERLTPALEGLELDVEGEVLGLPQAVQGFGGQQGWRLVLGLSPLPGQVLPAGTPRQVLALGYPAPGQSAWRAGERWQLRVKLQRAPGLANPHGFDQTLWMLEQDLQARAQIRPGLQRRLAEAPWHCLAHWREAWRDRLTLALSRAATAPAPGLGGEASLSPVGDRTVDPRSGPGLLIALSLGDQASIPSQDWQVYRDTGVAHLVAISGMHITLFAWALAALAGRLWRTQERLCLVCPAPQAGAWLGALAATAYAVFAGWGVPAQRTVWMLLGLTALRQGAREWPWPLCLLAAAWGVALVDPWAVCQAGFWLSFGAVALLMSQGQAPQADAQQRSFDDANDEGSGHERDEERDHVHDDEHDHEPVDERAHERAHERGNDRVDERDTECDTERDTERDTEPIVADGMAAGQVGGRHAHPTSSGGPGIAARVAGCALANLASCIRAHRPSRWPSWWGALATLVREQAVVTLGLAPLTLMLFQQLSLVGLLANLVSIPLVSYVLTPLALAGIAWPGLWTLAAWLAGHWIHTLTTMAGWPSAVLSLPVAPLWAQAAGLLGALLLVLPLPRSLRLAGLPMLLGLLWPAVPLTPAGRFELLAADVGQGTAVLVRTRSHLLLYDAGPRWGSGADAGQRVLLPLMRALGWSTLDALVISHQDLDHVGGASAILRQLPPALLLSSLPPGHALRKKLVDGAPGPAQLRALGGPTRHRSCERGQHWHWDGVAFEVLHPGPLPVEPPRTKAQGRPNHRSCVLQITDVTGHRALLTGDIEAPDEEEMLAQGQVLPADVLVLPHHGSRTSSTPALIAAVAPRLALAQAGYRNRFGHPHPAVLARYAAAGIPVWQSAGCGAWRWLSGEALPRCERERAPRYWDERALAPPPAVEPALWPSERQPLVTQLLVTRLREAPRLTRPVSGASRALPAPEVSQVPEVPLEPGGPEGMDRPDVAN